MLTNEQKTEIARIYALTCKAFDKTLDADVLKMQVEDLSDLDFEQIKKALENYRIDEKSTIWPRAGKIRALVNPVMSADAVANEAASLIREAISKFGWPNGSEARKFVGELGWAIVERSGGWSSLCENHGLSINPLTFHAQSRDLAKAIIEKRVKVDNYTAIEGGLPKNLIDFKLREIEK